MPDETLALTAEGEWLADGEPIEHELTKALFSKSLTRHDDGSWWLEVGRERKPVEVEDTAYFVRSLIGTAEHGYRLRLSDGSEEPLRPETLLLINDRLTCLTAAGHEAKFLRAPYAELLMQTLERTNGTHELKIQGMKIPIETPVAENILFFDGICGLCNSTVDFLLRHDRTHQLCFAPLQGRTSSALVSLGDRKDLDSVIFRTKNGFYCRSDAVLRATLKLGGWWKATALFLLIPRTLRDPLYQLVAKNRYRWFGKLDACRIPSKQERMRFLD
jgi:predicted DCC family thiol-disulfide oxidoreductase YuxK